VAACGVGSHSGVRRAGRRRSVAALHAAHPLRPERCCRESCNALVLSALHGRVSLGLLYASRDAYLVAKRIAEGPLATWGLVEHSVGEPGAPPRATDVERRGGPAVSARAHEPNPVARVRSKKPGAACDDHSHCRMMIAHDNRAGPNPEEWIWAKTVRAAVNKSQAELNSGKNGGTAAFQR